MLQSKITHVLSLSTNSPAPTCEICHTDLPYGGNCIAFNANHYLQQHEYTLLHVGQETTDVDGKLYHHTVAILGK
jgi:hypothetical protein